MNAVGLLLFVVVIHFGPQAMQGVKAWEYVAYGFEAAVLWGVVLLLARDTWVRLISAWALFESLERPICRLAFPMDSAPKLEPGQTLCDAALGFSANLISILVALTIAMLMQERLWK